MKDLITNSYIGITGFTRKSQVLNILEQMPEHKPGDRLLMMGILVSSKTMFEYSGTPRYANVNIIKDIFVNDPRVLNMIHFNFSKNDSEEYQKKCLLPALIGLTAIGGENLHGFQLNMPWPNITIISKYKNEFPDKIFVIQMGAQDFLDHSPERMAEKLKAYNGLCEYVILDMSMGAGKELDRIILTKYAKKINKINNMNIVFAGGLCAENIEILKPILKDFPKMCIDAEGRLMNINGILDIDRCKAYLRKALMLFA